jgi:hypothetical protein
VERRTGAATATRLRDAGTRTFLHTVASEYGVTTRTIDNWIREFFPDTYQRPTPATMRSASHPLLGLTGCGWCRRAFRHGRDGHHQPVYRCVGECRRLAPVSASELHTEVLGALRLHVPRLAADHGLHTAGDVFVRITVTRTARDLTLAWRRPAVRL